MFEKLTTLFTTSEDQFSRTQNQFVEHWNNVLECLSSLSALQAPNVYDTKASVHIADMIYMIDNDKIPDDSDYGPCVEFILQNDVLATLQLHAQNDIPVGLRKIVLAFFSQLVQKLQRSAIPHLHVHKPLQDMICVCGGGKYPIDEINFLTSVVSKFHEDPSLVNLFMNETRSKNGSVNYELRLVDALISLSHSKDDRVVKKSCESLLLCVAADSEYIIDSVLSYTILVQDLVSRLCQRYNSFQSDPDQLLSTSVSWNSQLESVLLDGVDRVTIRLLLWLDYLNTLTGSSHPNFVNKFLRHLAKVFLQTHILNDFKSAQPLDVVKALAMCQKMLIVVTSELLLVEVLKFLTDDPVITTLCSLLNHEDTRVLTSALVLLNELFETRHSLVIETLVLRYTRRNVNVRSRLLLEREEAYSPILVRANSSDSGVDEMYSDEETSFIHMDTSMVAHFESDHQSPSLARKLQQLAVTESRTPSEVTSLGTNVTSSESVLPTTSNVIVRQTDGASSSAVLETQITTSNQDTDIGGITSAVDSNQCNLRSDSVDTDSSSGELASDSRTSFALSDFSQEPSVSGNPEPDTRDHNSVSNKCDRQEPNTPESSRSDLPESEEIPVNPIVTALKSSSITLEHNRVGSANHFKTVIVSHDQAEDVRKCDKSGKIVLRLDASVAKFVDAMQVLSQPKMTGFNEYLYDAHLKAKEVELSYSWIPAHYNSLEEEDLTSDIGVFLEKVFSMVTSIPFQTYTVNMLVMSLVSEIAYIPHNSVTLLLLDTSLPAPPLYSALLDVSQQFLDIFEASPTLKDQLVTVPDSEMPDICKAAVLTEEFCKELAAVTLVKSTT
ncbi:hypothetical protein ACHWQZ_G016809 [Mnemiopsis leidyi]